MTAFDTDIFTLHFFGQANVVRRAKECRDPIGTTIITRIEVLRGRFDNILKAADGAELLAADRRLAEVQSQLDRVPTLPLDADSAATFDRLRSERKLRSIGRADLLIACICLAHKATLVTRNLRHFRAVPGLTVENWAD